MTDLRSKITREKVQAELWFCACLYYGSYDIALRDSCWLDPAIFSDAGFGKYWELVRGGGNPLWSVAQVGGDIEQRIIMDGYKAITIHPNEYAIRIADGAFMLSAIDSAQGIAKGVMDNDYDAVRQIATDLSNAVPQRNVEYHTAASIGPEFDKFIQANDSPVIRTFIPQIDKEIGGFFPRDMIILASRPGIGKTALATQVARNNASNGKKVLMASLEMDHRQLWARMACGMCEINWSDVRVGDITDEQRKSLVESSEKLARAYGDRLVIVDSVFTVEGIIQAVSHIKPDFVIIDHLGEIDWRNPDESEVVWYGKATKAFRQHIGKRYGLPVLLIHHINRKIEDRPDKRPLLSDLMWSSAIERIADVVAMMHREDYYDGDKAVNALVSATEILVRKNRQGKSGGTINLSYDLKKQWFM
jgi:replicative DNA helicase